MKIFSVIGLLLAAAIFDAAFVHHRTAAPR
jgi:hypothetical protein